MGIISSIAGIAGAKKQKKIAKRQAAAAEAQAAAEREKQRIEQVRANLQVRQEKQSQLRQQRLRRAQILSSAALAGVGGSQQASSVQGALGSVASQFGSNIGSINVQQGFSEAISEQNEASAAQGSEINRLQGKANVQAAKTQVFQSIGNLGQSVFDRAGGFTTVFGGNSFGGG